MKHSLILELQSLATDSSHDVCDLLRKALLVATKLKLNDFKSWIESELNGYDTGDVPVYRKARASVWVKNPYRGLIPVYFPNEEIADLFCNVELRDPIGSLVSILKAQDSDRTDPVCPLTAGQEAFLIKQQGGTDLPPTRTVSHTSIDTVIDAVRTQILTWSSKLEEEGILGEEMTFTKEEKETAEHSREIRIENFQGILGNVDNSTVDQTLEMAIKKGNLDSLKEYLRSLRVSEDDLNELEEVLLEEPEPPSAGKLGPRVGGWVGKMVGKAASGLWNIGVTVAGQVLTRAISMYYGI